jgi:glyoxylase-like metal-dependent hydrolase (beta-lactamase superfamily II)
VTPLRQPLLPAHLTVLERGWLSSNSIVILGHESTALIDSGYCTHAEQTLLLVDATLAGRALDVLVNTHLHSDHCGANAALQQCYPALQTHIPPGLAQHVQHWNPSALTFTPTGQLCPPFRFDAVLQPQRDIRLGDALWQVHAAPGHDPHSVILFEPVSRVLASADALWENGFGVVFPELDGADAFDVVAQTLDLIEALAPQVVIPGHGPVFTDVAQALAAARKRLRGFVENPLKHSRYAAKVLLKFKLLELQRVPVSTFTAWAQATAYLTVIHANYFETLEFPHWIEQLLQELVSSGAAALEDGVITNV